MRKTNLILLGAFLAFTFDAPAKAPAGYYRQCDQKCGAQLLVALQQCVSSFEVVGYNGLWDLYKQSDVYADGTIWDMYSTKHWKAGTDQCGNYSSIGDCYNREHSVPKSWFKDALPMYADAFHIYPTDGKVNGQRANYPFGECDGGSRVSSRDGVDALGKLGTCTYPGYSGIVFEPDDMYKGDFARSYFYMAACYNDRVSTWDSPMFNGTTYPVFEPWVVSMLMEWHRKDPVSQKEIDRNEAVYHNQGNRNPFIDSPDLAEHIWGTRQNQGWDAGSELPVGIVTPADGSTIDAGFSAVGIARSNSVRLVAANATGDVRLSATGPFTVNPTTVNAATANAGTDISIEFRPTAAGRHNGLLTISCGEAASTVLLTGEAVDGIPVNAAEQVRSDGFTARWIYVGGDTDGNYKLTVSDREGILVGYPKAVNARAETFIVNGLTPSTDYTYTLNGATISGNTVAVHTTGVLPLIDFLFDGDLYLTSRPGQPSEAAEIIMSTENIDCEIDIEIGEPFELSADKSSWSRMLRMSPDENRFYLRINGNISGDYESALVATADGYRNDHATVRGTIRAAKEYFEDFETDPGVENGYVDLYAGATCSWAIKDGGFWKADRTYEGRTLRFGKTAESFIAMAEDSKAGLGTVSFMAARWDNSKEPAATVILEISTDSGASWVEKASFEISETDFKPYSFYLGAEGKVRFRLRQTSGQRWHIDNIKATTSSTGLSDVTARRHSWDAYSGPGCVKVEVMTDSVEIALYCIDGTTVFSGKLTRGEHSFEAVAGQYYIVASGDFSRTVRVR